MSRFTLQLLGPPQFRQDEAPVSVMRRKGVALLAYLAMDEEPQSRDLLATLLWPGYGQSQARGNLRRTLYALKSAIGEDVLEITENELTLVDSEDVWCDVRVFRQTLAGIHEDSIDTAALRTALDLYRGDFLEGFSLDDSADFDAWQMRAADMLQMLFIEGSDRLITQLGEQKAFDEAIAAAQRTLAIQPDREATHRMLMELYALRGDRASALRQFERCAAVLKTEQGLDPDEQTQELMARIRRGAFGPAPSIDALALSQQLQRRRIPALPTGFVPRRQDQQAILARLQDPACRLLTLLGPGGMGKTYLATQAATELAGDEARFPDGVVWVDVAGIVIVDAVPAAVAEAAGLRFHRDAPEQGQLVGYFADKSLLLILDNLEHLVAAAELVAQLLVGAPGCKILVTSRTALQLRGEWLYSVGGMLYPGALTPFFSTNSGHLVDYGAVRLFVQAAVRHQNHFVLEDHADAVLAICRAVDGMPLALEMAAAWLKILSCEEIASLLSDHIEMLAARSRDAPPRQASMTAIFDTSWIYLSAQQQAALARLSVLRGQFGRHAAEAVAGLTVIDMEALIDHSFVQRVEGEDAYRIHELLRQLAARKLQLDPDVAEKTHRAHADYYARYLEKRFAGMLGVDQVVALAALNARIDNISAAWRWAVQNRQIDLVRVMAQPLFEYYAIRSKFQEGKHAAEDALIILAPDNASEIISEAASDGVDDGLLAQLCNRAAYFQYFSGELAESRSSASTARALAARAGATAEEAYAFRLLGMNAYRTDDYPAAEALLNQALALYQQVGDEEGLAATWYALGRCAMWESNIEFAIDHFQKSLAVSRRLQRPDWIAYALDMLAFSNFNRRNYPQSIDYFEEALQLFQAIDDWRGVAKTIGGAERSRLLMGHGSREIFEEAGKLALQLFEAIGEKREVAGRCHVLCETLLYVVGDIGAARAYIDRGVAISSQSPASTEYRACLRFSGVVAVAEGDYDRARRDLLSSLRLCQTAGDKIGEQEILAESALLLAHGRDLFPEDGRTPEECRFEAVRRLSMVRANSPVYVWTYIQDWVDEYLSRLTAELPADAFAAAEAEGVTLDPHAVVASLLAGLEEMKSSLGSDAYTAFSNGQQT